MTSRGFPRTTTKTDTGPLTGLPPDAARFRPMRPYTLQPKRSEIFEFLRETGRNLRLLTWTKLVPNVRPLRQFLLESADKVHILAAQLVIGEEETVRAEQRCEFSPCCNARNPGLIDVFR